jgi:ribosomal protein S18 acetylase RimI-like enzyme
MSASRISILKYSKAVFSLAMIGRLVIRPAQQSDREAVFRLCEHAFDGGDYVPDVWDMWLREQHSRVFTATLDGVPVGIMRVVIQKPGEAWFQAARTHPNHRRVGIATTLAEACWEWARNNGAKTVRLSTDSDNYAAQEALKKLGFTRISDFVIMKRERPQPQKADNCRWARKGDVERIWKFLADSEAFKASARLYTVLFVWMSLDKKDLTRFVTGGKAIIHQCDDDVDGLVLIDETVRDVWDNKPIQTCYVDGERRAIFEMIGFLETYAHAEEFETVYAFACNTPLIVEALTEAGFSRDDQNTEFIYHKTLSL